MSNYNDYPEAALQAKCAGGLIGRQTRRQQLEYRRSVIQSDLDAVNAAITALDNNPELEQFLEVLARAGA